MQTFFWFQLVVDLLKRNLFDIFFNSNVFHFVLTYN